ncbi:NDP-sugar synthase [Methanolapillus millepedarum]|uniref:Bifunctional protein GlmU n=1 Tax=Methanolapillus millepedarum TaxID=3028296 RepID=A0AA96V2H2_9EURY|nr:UTP--glucose-1-phosphate uridylyltransferase [Methanosarcinaceae archaeon Ac7]
MKACIMCGGTGTRLRPLTFRRPKPSIPILNKPSVLHLIEHLSNEGFNDIILTLGYMGDEIERELGDGSVYGVHIDYVYEKTKLGTAGSVKNAQELIGDEPFIVLGGDHVMTLNLREMYRFHQQNDALVTIGLLSIDDPREFGIADMAIDNRILRFFEKPKPGEIFSNLASTGIYVCSPEIFNEIPKDQKYDFAKDLFPKLLSSNQRINGVLVRGKWTDVGSAVAYRAAQKWMLDDMSETILEGEFESSGKILGPIRVGANVSIGKNSSVVGPVIIGENTKIGERVLVGPYSVIGSDCVIGDDVKILASYVFDGTRIGSKTTLSGAIVDSNADIGAGCSLENGTIIGPDAKVEDGATIHSGVKLWPEVVVSKGMHVTEDVLNEKYDSQVNGS